MQTPRGQRLENGDAINVDISKKALRSHHNSPVTTEDKYVHICMIDVCVSAKNHHRVSLLAEIR